MTDYESISKQAEADLNTYQSKTGNARPQGLDEAGVNSFAEKKFDSAEVKYGDELSTNRGNNRRIPPSEGGILDDRGRQTRGVHFEGKGGPLDKLQDSYDKQPGQNDNDVVPARVPHVEGIGGVGDIATQGKQATKANVGDKPPGPGGSQFKGDEYYTPESVPDSISAEGWIPPESVTQSSKETEGYSTR
ncbi:hypothetical protein MAC_01747 [Metarhizium acridum CQMa 102]|uniref:Uncharacterized protein n=1 Tax=Metarhizium acridum (strain CQMa 102) TaxID=655827 RepID=E9DVU9_METAQ|nr:uncharacterized protein MAC_01747 [Metarhizium acridum CQMa 102]EFY92146.1 hypothetical protein MAC_01747 [Metarhizium acridum CQMa 102]